MAVVASVAINVDSRDAAAKLRQFQQQSTAASKAADGLATATQKAGATAAKSANQFSGASRSINSLIGTLGKLAVAYAGVRAAQSAIQAGIGRVESERRIQFLARSYGEVDQLANAAAASAAKFGESQTTANQSLANAYARLRPVGVSLGDIVSTYNGFNTAARISGASSVEASNAFTQLAQALGSGALRGDEFNSIAEQVPGILTAISKETGVAQGALRNYAADGKITADVVIRALKRIETEGASQLEEALNGPQQKIKDFQNASEDLAVAFSRELIPQMTDAVKALASALRSLEPILVGLGKVAAQVFNYIAGLANRIVDLSSGGRRAQAEIQASAEAQRVTRERFGLRVLSPEARQFRQQYEKNLLFNFDAQERERRRAAASLPTAGAVPTPTPAPAPAPSGAAAGRKGGGKSEAEKAAEKAARAAEQLKEQTEQQLKAAKDLQFTQANQLLQLRAKNDFERTFVEFGIKRSEIERKYNELLQQSKSTEETKLLQQARAAEYKQSSLILEQRALELTKQATQPLDDILKNLQDQAAYQREYGELIKNGTNPELAKQIIEINRAYEASVAALEPAIAAARAAVTKAEAEGASATEIEKYRKELERIQEIQGGLESKRGQAIGAAKEGAAKQPTVLDGIGERIKQLQADLNPIKLATDSIVSGADAIGQAFGQAFQDVATGAKSTQEALADAFKGIGQAFISMAAEIIAKQLTLILLQTIFNALSGGFGGGSAPRGTPGAKAPNGLPYYGPAFADGGFVTGPTQALIGEGGEPEYVIPASKMRSAMARYSNGARGEAVIPGSGAEPTAANGEAIATGAIDVRYTVERINSVDYVTADQFQRGMAQAASQGAKQGEQLAMRRLQQSASTRSRLGI